MSVKLNETLQENKIFSQSNSKDILIEAVEVASVEVTEIVTEKVELDIEIPPELKLLRRKRKNNNITLICDNYNSNYNMDNKDSKSNVLVKVVKYFKWFHLPTAIVTTLIFLTMQVIMIMVMCNK